MRLGKPIPEKDPTLNVKHVRSTIPGPPDATLRSSGSTLCTKVVTGTSTMLITPKMKFEQSTTLLSTNPTDEAATAAAKEKEKTPPGRANADTDMEPAAGKENGNEEPTKIYGEEYMPAVRGADNKITGYRCSLCECDTTDESGRVLHLKGRRHLQNYKVCSLNSVRSRTRVKVRNLRCVVVFSLFCDEVKNCSAFFSIYVTYTLHACKMVHDSLLFLCLVDDSTSRLPLCAFCVCISNLPAARKSTTSCVLICDDGIITKQNNNCSQKLIRVSRCRRFRVKKGQNDHHHLKRPGAQNLCVANADLFRLRRRI